MQIIQEQTKVEERLFIFVGHFWFVFWSGFYVFSSWLTRWTCSPPASGLPARMSSTKRLLSNFGPPLWPHEQGMMIPSSRLYFLSWLYNFQVIWLLIASLMVFSTESSCFMLLYCLVCGASWERNFWLPHSEFSRPVIKPVLLQDKGGSSPYWPLSANFVILLQFQFSTVFRQWALRSKCFNFNFQLFPANERCFQNFVLHKSGWLWKYFNLCFTLHASLHFFIQTSTVLKFWVLFYNNSASLQLFITVRE